MTSFFKISVGILSLLFSIQSLADLPSGYEYQTGLMRTGGERISFAKVCYILQKAAAKQGIPDKSSGFSGQEALASSWQQSGVKFPLASIEQPYWQGTEFYFWLAAQSCRIALDTLEESEAAFFDVPGVTNIKADSYGLQKVKVASHTLVTLALLFEEVGYIKYDTLKIASQINGASLQLIVRITGLNIYGPMIYVDPLDGFDLGHMAIPISRVVSPDGKETFFRGPGL